MAVSLENEVIKSDFFEDDWGQEVHQQAIRRRLLKTEDESLLDYPHNYEGMYIITNEAAKNRWGNCECFLAIIFIYRDV